MQWIADSSVFLVGSGSQKAFEAPGSTVVMDVGQVEWNLRM